MYSCVIHNGQGNASYIGSIGRLLQGVRRCGTLSHTRDKHKGNIDKCQGEYSLGEDKWKSSIANG